MPISSLAVDLGVFLFILLVVAFIGLWLYRRGKDRQALKDTLEALQASENARKREREIVDAAKKIREAPGPVVPGLDELQRGAGGKTRPA